MRVGMGGSDFFTLSLKGRGDNYTLAPLGRGPG